MPGSALGRQGFQGRHGQGFDPARVQAIRNRPRTTAPTDEVVTAAIPEPAGGLWTSTVTGHDSGFASAWTDWARGEEFVPANTPMSVLRADAEARIYRIDGRSDLDALRGQYPAGPLDVDWEAVGRDFDAVHLTAKGAQETRYGLPNLYTWEVESTLWLRPRFTIVQQGTVAEPAKPAEEGR
jgi:hypothetical protein